MQGQRHQLPNWACWNNRRIGLKDANHYIGDASVAVATVVNWSTILLLFSCFIFFLLLALPYGSVYCLFFFKFDTGDFSDPGLCKIRWPHWFVAVVLPVVFSLTWPASIQIYWNKRKRLHKKRVQLPEDWFGTPTWPPIHCFGTPIWPPWRHMKTPYI